MSKNQSTIATMSRASTFAIPTAHSEQSLGPNLKTRLEALEAAMGVRLNVAKRQGRQSLSNTTSSSPMQISPTSTSSTTISATATTSLSISSRHNIPMRSGQGVQRSASSCDTENRPGPIKRLKPSLPAESSSTSTAIATIKKSAPPVRRPITTLITPPRSIQPKQSPLTKQRSSPMNTSSSSSSLRSSRSSTTSSNNTNYHTLIRLSSKTSPTTSSTAKQILIKSSSLPSSSPTPPARPATLPRKHCLPIFGEQFSDDILRTNLLWINLNELDDEGHTEVLIQFGSIENFVREQQLFSVKQQQQQQQQRQQQQAKLVTRNKIATNRSRLQLSIPKKDRLELL